MLLGACVCVCNFLLFDCIYAYASVFVCVCYFVLLSVYGCMCA